jgi:hypothetical protein
MVKLGILTYCHQANIRLKKYDCYEKMVTLLASVSMCVTLYYLSTLQTGYEKSRLSWI